MILLREKADLALVDMVRAQREPVETARAAVEAAQQALRECVLAQGAGDQSSTQRRSVSAQETRLARRREEELRNALDDCEIELADATRELASAEKAARAEIVAARRPGLKVLAGELFAALAQVAEVNARAWDYEVKTAELLEESSTVAQVAWPEFFSEPNRESLLELRERLARQAGLL